VRFLIDGQLPPALAARLNAIGHDALHIYDIGLGDSGDAEVWQHAKNDGRIIVSKDEDFVALANRESSGPAVLWLRVGNTTTNRALWSAFLPRLPEIIVAFENGERVVEVR
jgi:predicted nuclease of predicted toxin-antitoxin system